MGYWMTDYPYGPTWVSSEPWGYAPYHYGRWAFVGNRWYWIPDTINTAPTYSPALVAWVPFGQNEIGWVPLGPGDVYVPRYYNAGWQPYYLTNDSLYQRVVNLDVPGAVMVVPIDEFARGFDWRRARRADRDMLAGVNPVLDPLLFTPLRNAVINSAWGRGKKDIPPGIAKKLDDTVVVTSTAPIAPAFRPDLRRSMRVETVSDRGKGQKFKVRDERGNGRSMKSVERPQPVQAPGRAERPANRGQEKKQAVQSERPVRQSAPAQQQRPVNRGQEKRQAAQSPRPVRQPAPVRQQQPANRGQEKRQAAQADRPVRPAQQQPKAERVAQPKAPQPKAEKPKGVGKAQGQGAGKGKGKKP
jgi:hypothetical protein